jgi:hypothetical protein
MAGRVEEPLAEAVFERAVTRGIKAAALPPRGGRHFGILKIMDTQYRGCCCCLVRFHRAGLGQSRENRAWGSAADMGLRTRLSASTFSRLPGASPCLHPDILLFQSDSHWTTVTETASGPKIWNRHHNCVHQSLAPLSPVQSLDITQPPILGFFHLNALHIFGQGCDSATIGTRCSSAVIASRGGRRTHLGRPFPRRSALHPESICCNSRYSGSTSYSMQRKAHYSKS